MTHVKTISRVKIRRAEDEDVTQILSAIFSFVIEIIQMKGKAVE